MFLPFLLRLLRRDVSCQDDVGMLVRLVWEFSKLKKRLINSPVVSPPSALLACTEAVVQTRRHAFLAVRESTRLAMGVAETCIDCEVGKYSPVSGATTCVDCGYEKYTDTKGASSQSACKDCKTCPVRVNTVPHAGSLRGMGKCSFGLYAVRIGCVLYPKCLVITVH